MGSYERRMRRAQNRKRGKMKSNMGRKLTLTTNQFGTFVFPPLGRSSAKNDSDWETALRLMKKLKDPGLAFPVPLTEEEEKAVAKPGVMAFQFYELLEAEAVFLLQDDEWRFLQKRLKENRNNVPLAANDEYEELLQTVNDAEEYTVEQKPAKETAGKG